MENFPVFKALCGDNPEQNAATIHAFNPEHLPVLRLYAGIIWNRTRGQSAHPIRNTSLLLRLYVGTLHGSNPEHLLVFKALRAAGLLMIVHQIRKQLDANLL